MAEVGRISPETIKNLEAQFANPRQKNHLEQMIGMDVDPMLKNGLDEVEAIQIGGAMARTLGYKPNPEKLEILLKAYSAEIEAGTVDPADLESISGFPEIGQEDTPAQPTNRREGFRRGADAGEQPDGKLVVAFVNPDTGEVASLKGAARTEETTAHTVQVDNEADYAEIAGADIPKLDDMG